jgi:hypothetical protein
MAEDGLYDSSSNVGLLRNYNIPQQSSGDDMRHEASQQQDSGWENENIDLHLNVFILSIRGRRINNDVGLWSDNIRQSRDVSTCSSHLHPICSFLY